MPWTKCNFVGKGYNIIKGDPLAAGADPGWTYKIFDQQWVDANAEVSAGEYCNYESKTSLISGAHSAQASRKSTTKISASAGGWGVKIAFTGSDSVNHMQKLASSHSTHFAEARASCELFFAKLPPPGDDPPVFHPNFEAQVRRLPTETSSSSDEKLEKWMSYYGTHYASGVTMGGMMVRRWTMKESTYNSLHKDATSKGFNVEAGYDGLFSVKANAEHNQDSEATNAVTSAMSSEDMSTFYQGGTPFVGGHAKKWADGLNQVTNGVPGYVPVAGAQNALSPITELLTQLNFPGLDPKIQGIAEEFAHRLCTEGGPNLDSTMCNDLCHCTEDKKIECSLTNDPEFQYCSTTQVCYAPVDKKVPFGQWPSLCKTIDTKDEP